MGWTQNVFRDTIQFNIKILTQNDVSNKWFDKDFKIKLGVPAQCEFEKPINKFGTVKKKKSETENLKKIKI